ncbi:MAG: hypothetical protein ABSB24_01810 [Gaiellaceae bacterium]|jgi:hypothetical protein
MAGAAVCAMLGAEAIVTRRRILLFGVAGLLSASALLAIGILLVGRFGSTEGRILGTTALLAGYGLVTLPATVLLDQARLRVLAVATASLAAVSASLALASVWTPSQPDALGNSVGAVTAFALAGAQMSALAARRQRRDPDIVRRIFAVSCGTVLVAASLFAGLIWTQPSGLYPRLFGALVVLDLLLVALQPILARARPAGPVHRLRVLVDSGEVVALTIEGGDLAAAAAKAIRTVERDGRHVAGLEVGSAGVSSAAARTRT